VQAYTDGTSSKDGVGAAAVLRIHGKTQTVAGKRLGEKGAHSILDAEIAAILIAAHLILSIPLVDDATIFSDSQTAIRCVQGKAIGATLALVKAARRAIKRARDKAGGTEVKLQWCPGHSDIRGNELADAEAKAAARGKSYPAELVPGTLAKYRPPTNANTLKRQLKEANLTSAKVLEIHQGWSQVSCSLSPPFALHVHRAHALAPQV
jgi:ribonuclease HI